MYVARPIETILAEEIDTSNQRCMLEHEEDPCNSAPALYFPKMKKFICRDHIMIDVWIDTDYDSYPVNFLLVECSSECNRLNGHPGECAWLDL